MATRATNPTARRSSSQPAQRTGGQPGRRRGTSRSRAQRRRRRRRQRILACAVLFLAAVLFGLVLWQCVHWVSGLLGNKTPGIYTIAVDAGHGGADVGADGLIRECDMTAETAELLYGLLQADPHYIPCRTRDSYDEGATPAERADAANRHRADLLISIHGNSAAEEGVRGFECYPPPPGRDQHDESMRFAALVSQQMSDAGAPLRGTNGVRYAYYDENGQKFLVDAADSTVRKDKTFGILENAKCPALLVEQCFVTNPEDMAQFTGASGCSLCADRYYRAICEYFGTTPYPAPEPDSSSAS